MVYRNAQLYHERQGTKSNIQARTLRYGVYAVCSTSVAAVIEHYICIRDADRKDQSDILNRNPILTVKSFVRPVSLCVVGVGSSQ